MTTYTVDVVPMEPRPLDEGITLHIEIVARSARDAGRRVLRYVKPPAVVTEIRRNTAEMLAARQGRA